MDDAAASAVGTVGLTGATTAYKLFHTFLPKAQLYVPKTSSMADAGTVASAATMKNDSAALRSLLIKKRAVAKAALSPTGAAGKLKQAMGVVPVFGLLAASTVENSVVTTALSANNYYVMDVQYNPKSIQIYGTGGGELRGPQNGDPGVSQLTISSRVSRLKLSVELVFEDIDNADAFHSEGLEMNAEALAGLAEAGLMRLLDGHSVQKQCDGLLALLNFKRLKQVVFLWGNMFFHGELTAVNVQYEMFNRYGNPILAKVQLTIEQSDSQKSIRYESDMEQWDDAVDFAFHDKTIL